VGMLLRRISWNIVWPASESLLWRMCSILAVRSCVLLLAHRLCLVTASGPTYLDEVDED
jgi:hypothetical protein